MKKLYIILLVVVCLLGGAAICLYNSRYRAVVFPARPLRVRIQPFTGADPAAITQVAAMLTKHLSSITVNKPISLPASAFYPPRARYRADSLLRFLHNLSGDSCTIIGITASDISTSKDGKTDWGIMGLANQPGNVCINSTFRLSKKNTVEQLYKLCLHELGHTLGLPHCPVKTCYMRDAEGGNHKDEETGFCPSCAATLKRRGLKLDVN